MKLGRNKKNTSKLYFGDDTPKINIKTFVFTTIVIKTKYI